MRHIKNKLSETLEPLQFDFHENRSTEDVFVGYSSVCNTTIPSNLTPKHKRLDLGFKPFSMQVGSGPLRCQTSRCAEKQGHLLLCDSQYVLLSLLQFSLFTHDCVGWSSAKAS